MRTYRHPRSGFEIDIPSAWRLAEDETGVEVSPPPGASDQRASLSVKWEPRGPSDMLDQEMRGVTDFIRQLPDFQLLGEENGTGAGTFPARRFAARMAIAGEPLIIDTVMIETDRAYLLFTFMATPVSFSQELPHAVRALESLRVGR